MGRVMDREKVGELLKKDNFRAWLKRKPKKEVIGYRRVDGSCPIATYLRENNVFGGRVGTLALRFGYETIWYSDLDEHWYKCFIYAVDAPKGVDKCSAGKALEYLEKC